MSISQKDIKLLWGRAANRCSICKTKLSQGIKSSVNSDFTIGEQAHIISEKADGPRGRSAISIDERNSYHNLILLCPNHHTEIDKNESIWSVEKLYLTKSKHELWVDETLNETSDKTALAKQMIISSIVDSAVELCRFEEWHIWTENALSPDPNWDVHHADLIFRFMDRVNRAIWPKEYDEFKRSTITLSIVLQKAANKFMANAEYCDRRNVYKPIKFYKALAFNPNYDSDLRKYTDWVRSCYDLVYEATKAANWFADVVRRDVNPLFYATEGKFSLINGPFQGGSYYGSIPEYTDLEKLELPSTLSLEE